MKSVCGYITHTMSVYDRHKLSEYDKRILQHIYNTLEQVQIRTTLSSNSFHAEKAGAISQVGARQACFGIVRHKGAFVKSRPLKDHPEIMRLFKKFMRSHCPSFKFNSVYVNKNVVCKPHFDAGNVGKSMLVGMGPYTRGRSILHIRGKQKRFHIKSHSLVFDGSLIKHESEEFKGTRYSLVFFKASTR